MKKKELIGLGIVGLGYLLLKKRSPIQSTMGQYSFGEPTSETIARRNNEKIFLNFLGSNYLRLSNNNVEAAIDNLYNKLTYAFKIPDIVIAHAISNAFNFDIDTTLNQLGIVTTPQWTVLGEIYERIKQYFKGDNNLTLAVFVHMFKAVNVPKAIIISAVQFVIKPGVGQYPYIRSLVEQAYNIPENVVQAYIVAGAPIKDTSKVGKVVGPLVRKNAGPIPRVG